MTPRSTAAARREQIVAASIKRFAMGGFHGTSTEDIAADVELSQPYLFRLFGTKRDLFLACCEACDERIRSGFTDACTGDTAEERLKSMGQAYRGMLDDEYLLRFQLQMYAAAGDPEIRKPVADSYRALIDELRRLAGATEDETINFVSIGMFINVATSLGLDDVLASWRGEA